MLGALARPPATVQLSTLVTGNTYRKPPMLAKAVTTLDVVSKAGHPRASGPAGSSASTTTSATSSARSAERFERLEEALRNHRADAAGREPDFKGNTTTSKTR